MGMLFILFCFDTLIHRPLFRYMNFKEKKGWWNIYWHFFDLKNNNINEYLNHGLKSIKNQISINLSVVKKIQFFR